MSSRTARARRRRAERDRWTWPRCEHDGHERITGTAAELVRGAQTFLTPGPWRDSVVEGINLLAAETGPDDVLGVCPNCSCMTSEHAPKHPH